MRDTFKKLNICIVSREYPPETLWGGIGTFTYNLAHGLKKIGHAVDVVSFTLGKDSHQFDEGINIFRISSPAIPFSRRTFWDLGGKALFPFAFLYSLKIRKKISELHSERKYDILDFPEHIGEGFFTILFNRLPSVVRLYTPLYLIGKLGLRRSTNVLDYFLFGLMEKSSIKNATAVNSPSSNLAKLVNKEFKIGRNIKLIYNPIDTETFSPREGRKNKDSWVRILFVGRLEDRKGVHILAQAIPKIVKEANNVKFILLGNDGKGVCGINSMKEYMINYFKEHGCDTNVEFVAPVSYDKLIDYYSAVDISVVPSLYDNSPYTCLEAMACGLPVVGTSAGGMPEYIDHKHNGLIIPPGDPDCLAESLLELINDGQKRREYGNSARDKAVRVFKREIIARNITTAYLEAIEEFKKLN